MKIKIKTILLYSIVIALLMFFTAYVFRTVVDYGCSSPKLYSVQKTGTNIEQFGSISFFGVKCILWNRLIQLQYNY